VDMWNAGVIRKQEISCMGSYVVCQINPIPGWEYVIFRAMVVQLIRFGRVADVIPVVFNCFLFLCRKKHPLNDYNSKDVFEDLNVCSYNW
jgi:hypothetical protein